jgi:hypothetical protein
MQNEKLKFITSMLSNNSNKRKEINFTNFSNLTTERCPLKEVEILGTNNTHDDTQQSKKIKMNIKLTKKLDYRKEIFKIAEKHINNEIGKENINQSKEEKLKESLIIPHINPIVHKINTLKIKRYETQTTQRINIEKIKNMNFTYNDLAKKLKNNKSNYESNTNSKSNMLSNINPPAVKRKPSNNNGQNNNVKFHISKTKNKEIEVYLKNNNQSSINSKTKEYINANTSGITKTTSKDTSIQSGKNNIILVTPKQPGCGNDLSTSLKNIQFECPEELHLFYIQLHHKNKHLVYKFDNSELVTISENYVFE